MPKISEDYIVDRQLEQESFRELLALKDEKRLMLIEDKGGRGKSTLLAKLKYICKWDFNPGVPVSLNSLDQITTNDPLKLLQEIRKDLQKIDFKEFDGLNRARSQRDVRKFSGGFGSIHGSVDLRGGHVAEGGIAAGVYVAKAETVNISPEEWNQDIDDIARDECIKAFFKDLKNVCEKQQIVVLLDSVDEKASSDLREWVIDELVKPYCLDVEHRPAKFLLVLAGRKLPDFEKWLGSQECQRLIKSVKSLGEWTTDHVRDFLKCNEIQILSDADIEFLQRKIKEGMTFTKALQMAKEYFSGPP